MTGSCRAWWGDPVWRWWGQRPGRAQGRLTAASGEWQHLMQRWPAAQQRGALLLVGLAPGCLGAQVGWWGRAPEPWGGRCRRGCGRPFCGAGAAGTLSPAAASSPGAPLSVRALSLQFLHDFLLPVRQRRSGVCVCACLCVPAPSWVGGRAGGGARAACDGDGSASGGGGTHAIDTVLREETVTD